MSSEAGFTPKLAAPFGCERRDTGTAKGSGVFATAPFASGDIVIPGEVGRPVSGNDTHPNQVGIDEWVIEEGYGPLLNHSCDPNCGIHVNEEGAYDYVAIKRIAVGDELTWDYATRNYAINHFPPACLCASAGCRGSITGWRDLPDERRAAYAGYVAPYLLELDARADDERQVQEVA